MSSQDIQQDTASELLRLARPRIRLPFLRDLRNYTPDKFRHDLIAGTTLTLVSIPQAIGFSLILGLPADSVILSVVIGGFVSALFFSSHHHVFGPSTSVSIITAATIASAAAAGIALPPLQLAAYLALLIGLTQFIAGIFNFGEVTKFISRSVVVSYMAAIGILLIAGQAHNFMGYAGAAGATFIHMFRDAANALATDAVSLWSVGIGAATLLIFTVVKRLRPTWPDSLIGLTVMALAARAYVQYFPPTASAPLPFHLIRDEGALHALLPTLGHLPPLASQWEIVSHLANTVIAIAVIGMLEATAITKAIGAQSGQRVDSNQELIGMGAANIAAGLFGVPPGSSSFTRSAVNYQSGAATQFSSIISSIAVLVVLFVVTPVFNYIPIAALAAHLMRVGYHLINPAHIRVCTRSTRSDATVFFVTLLCALFLKLDTAIFAGIGLSLALFLQKTSTPTLVEYTFNDAGHLAELPNKSNRHDPQISIIHVEGELFFGAADLFQEQVRRQAEDEDIRVFILRMKNARHLDATTVMALESLYDYLRQTNRHIIISGANPDVIRVLTNSGLLKHIGPENLFAAETNPTMATRRALMRAQQLLQQHAQVRIFYNRKPEDDKAGDDKPNGGDEKPSPEANPEKQPATPAQSSS